MEFPFLMLLLSSALFGHGSGSPSCRYNCSNNLGSCSCSSFCQYNGNCCYDYYVYCGNNLTSPVPTATERYTEEHTVSDGPIQWAAGSTTGLAPCGGNLTQPQGTFFSPNYPNNYPDNARCTWKLSAGEGQKILLTFTFVSLESSYDHIRVYDGPSDQSKLLRHLTGNQLSSINSTSRYMTVVFSTDISGTFQGFRAEWTFKSSVTCGGSLHGSGFFSSPYYPRNYNNNADCEWRLSAPTGQTVFLSFLDFDLEHCCSCDYVNVSDGPSNSSPLIRQLCRTSDNTSHMEFNSSSSYMTVLFRSNYNGVGRGFKAYFSTILDQNTGHVGCFSDRMKIAIRNSYLDSLGLSWQDLYLDDHRCRASPDNNYGTFNIPLNSCNIKRKTQDGHIIYTNIVQAAQLTVGEITWRDKPFVLSVSCVMDRDSSVGILYEANEIKNVTIHGTGRFNITMAFYQSSSFYNPITKYPYEVTLSQQLYVQVQLTRPDSSLHLFIDSCVASPNHSLSYHNYYLISNGCRRDSKVTRLRNGDSYFAQFSFRAFKFLHMHNQVFLRCHVFICADNDYNSRCRQGCRNRRKRSLGSDDHTEVITIGPITLKGSKEAVVQRKMEDGEGNVK